MVRPDIGRGENRDEHERVLPLEQNERGANAKCRGNHIYELFLIRRHFIIIQNELGEIMKSRGQGIGRKPVALRRVQLQ